MTLVAVEVVGEDFQAPTHPQETLNRSDLSGVGNLPHRKKENW